MRLEIAFLLAIATGITGIFLGYTLRLIRGLIKKGSVELNVKEMMLKAEEDTKRITLEAEEKAAEILRATREDNKLKEEQIKKNEDRVIKKEEMLDRRQDEMNREVIELKHKIEEVKSLKERVDGLQIEKQKELEKVAGLNQDEAKEQLLDFVRKQSEEEILVRVRKLDNAGREVLDEKAKQILSTTIQRLASSVTADMFTSQVSIPSDDIKGKIIGKEGRNIKSLERETGVEILVDDTPGSITISSFDPIRRQIARVALEALIADGRIQPAKIEKEVEKAKEEINTIIKKRGEEAVFETGVIHLDPRVVSILGRLHYRTSYGQNVLAHSIEMSHIAGMLAEELGANVLIAKTGALLHDIGKAVDHEVQGTHVEIGRRILQKFGVSEEVVKAMQAHHEEYPYETIESIIVQTADSISGGRPGARKDNVENYLKRLQDLEAIASNYKGVEKSYALAAGRELRVFVFPTEVSDLEAIELAKDIAAKIETELKYPGEIKVSVIRESRAIEVAR